jgi:hypothetical protein
VDRALASVRTVILGRPDCMKTMADASSYSRTASASRPWACGVNPAEVLPKALDTLVKEVFCGEHAGH